MRGRGEGPRPAQRTSRGRYDGRASAAENFEERTGLAVGDGSGAFVADGDTPALMSPEGGGGLRYLSVVALPDGDYRLFYEASRADGAHRLRTERVKGSN
jgi:hypothetical protein